LLTAAVAIAPVTPPPVTVWVTAGTQ
jgi:hypothetical protein